jgi:octaprenyl-diphosphate synthase
MNLAQIRALVADELAATDQLILNSLNSDIPLASTIADHIVESGGKRLRPLIGLLTAKALNCQGDNHIKLAAIVELLHTATLLHDDVIDDSDMRRGKPTASNKWGNEASVLVGDLLYARAFQLIAEIQRPDITKLIADASSLIVEGEVLQLAHCHDPETTEQTYLEIVKRKTGQLFKIASCCSAMLVNSDQQTFQALADFGDNFGIAFQMLDDALDYDANPEETGKNLGDDLAEGKPTLPLIQALKTGSAEQAEVIRQAIKEGEDSNIDAIKTILDETKAIDYTKQLAESFVEKSVSNLNCLTDGPEKEALIALAKLSSKRSS